ncbi:MAG: indolepyruvate oxidoreductase subunit beta [Lachnospiraceae bacterium]|nr:indolepyruvate oxidoreductase subunit beta [Lachnospiraceae bacterium]
MNKDILICGVGGQGTVLASKIIAAAAMEEGNAVHSAETIGMAQRGGSVTSHVRIGEGAYSPLIPHGSAELLLAFEPAEAVRNLSYLCPGGTAVVNTSVVAPAGSASYDGEPMRAYLEKKCRCIFVDSEEVCRPFGSVRFFNIIITGIAAGAGVLGISRETLTEQIRRRVKPKFVEENLKAFAAGYEIGSGASRQV